MASPCPSNSAPEGSGSLQSGALYKALWGQSDMVPALGVLMGKRDLGLATVTELIKHAIMSYIKTPQKKEIESSGKVKVTL